MKVQVRKLTEPDELLHHYPGQSNAQPVVLAIDLEAGTLTAFYNPEIGTAVPDSVWHGREMWLSMPCLPTPTANELLDEAAPLVQRMLDDSSLGLNQSYNLVVDYWGDDARAAERELHELLEAWRQDPYGELSEMDAHEWFAAGDVDPTEEWGITAGSTDAELAALVPAITEQMKADGESSSGCPVAVTGVREYLEFLRQEQRDRANDEGDE